MTTKTYFGQTVRVQDLNWRKPDARKVVRSIFEECGLLTENWAEITACVGTIDITVADGDFKCFIISVRDRVLFNDIIVQKLKDAGFYIQMWK